MCRRKAPGARHCLAVEGVMAAVGMAHSNDAPADLGFRRYIQQVNTYPYLHPAEERELLQRWRQHKDAAAAHRIVTAHLRLVVKIARSYRGYGSSADDMISEGTVGMMHALDRFDPSTGCRFAAYAKYWIRSTVQAHILKSWSLVKLGTTAEQKRVFFNLRRLERGMQIVKDGDLLPEQVSRVARTLKVSERSTITVHRRMVGPDCSLNVISRGDSSQELQDFLVDVNPDQEVTLADREEMQTRRAALPRALHTLDERQRQILIERRLRETPTTLD
jgi:RNA polymerase sigma-32 factor